jgi:transposase
VLAISRGGAHDRWVAYNFVSADRSQRFLLPPDMADWLPEDHLAWFVIDVVDQIDLDRFRRVYRADGHGRPAYDPAVMVALLLYAYCSGVRSSRVIERRCVEDVAFRVLAGNLCPDHVTIARFRSRHADALAEVFIDSLRLCAEVGLVRLGVVALDGTKIGSDASVDANRTLVELTKTVSEMLAEAEATDLAEDEDPPADPTPKQLAGRAERLDRLNAAKDRLETKAAERAHRFEERTRASNETRAAKGLAPREFRPRPRSEAPQPNAVANVTDPESRLLRGRGGPVQGYNAQAACTADQVIVAAEVTQAANDVEQLAPMLAATNTTLAEAGIAARPETLVADAGYWRIENVNGSIPNAPELFIAVAKHARRGKPRKDGSPSASTSDVFVAAMKAKLKSDRGGDMMRMRRTTIEPVFGHIKDVRGARRFSRRGLDAAQAEWQLLCAAHNLTKLWRFQTRPA